MAKGVAAFHQALLGRFKEQTPEEFWLRDEHSSLYSAHEAKDARGYDQEKMSPTHFLSTFILALIQTEQAYPVYMFVAKPMGDWAVAQVESIARHIFRIRKGGTDSGINSIREAIRQLRLVALKSDSKKVDRWVMFGVPKTEAPAWAKEFLIP